MLNFKKRGDYLIDTDIEFRKGVLFIRINNTLKEKEYLASSNAIKELVSQIGIKYLVINFNEESVDNDFKLKLIINDYSLNNTILYLDLTDKNIDKLKLEDKNINYPAVLIYKNGKIISYFDIKKNNYDIKLLKEYLIEEGIINND